MNKKFTIKNTSHNTSVSFFAPPHPDGALGALWELQYDAVMFGDKNATAKINRIKKALCGSSSCGCAGMIREA